MSLPATPARADRAAVYSITGADCGDCGAEIRTALRKLKGVKSSSFDIYRVELTLQLADGVTDAQVVNAIEHAGEAFHATVGPGHGAYLPQLEYPEGVDLAVLTRDGSALGPLAKLRVPGKYTVFDVYADWCGPCRVLDGTLRKIVSTRPDVALRKLNVVSFETPLAKELAPRLSALPYVIVFAPDGKRTDVVGLKPDKLLAALGGK